MSDPSARPSAAASPPPRAILLVGARSGVRARIAKEIRRHLGDDVEIVETKRLGEGLSLPETKGGSLLVVAESDELDAERLAGLRANGSPVVVWMKSEDAARARVYLERGALDVVFPSRATADLYRVTREWFGTGVWRSPESYGSIGGLPARAEFQKRLSARRSNPDDGATTILLVGLDDFKAINRSLGHAAGDEVLRSTVARLRHCVRNADAIARWGGDEFVCLLEDTAHKKDAEVVAQRILYAFSRPVAVDGRSLYVSASIGVATSHDAAGRDDEMIQHAETAMHRAKQAGGNTFRFYAEKMEAGTAERLAVASALRDALRDEKFELFYQPLVDTGNGNVQGLEALLRWRDQPIRQRGPAEFVPVLEDTNLIVHVGEWVLRKACTQTRAWQYSGLSQLRVSVNLSPRQFRDGELARTVARVLQDTGLGAGSLQLELTESVLMDDPEQSCRVLREIKQLGVSIALDDFGTGHSSLGVLKDFPVDTLKIDRQFVKDIHRSEDARAICSAIVRLGQALKLDVVAEGVELEEQARILAEEGCRSVQGFLFAVPMPAADTWIWLTEEIAAPLAQRTEG